MGRPDAQSEINDIHHKRLDQVLAVWVQPDVRGGYSPDRPTKRSLSPERMRIRVRTLSQTFDLSCGYQSANFCTVAPSRRNLSVAAGMATYKLTGLLCLGGSQRRRFAMLKTCVAAVALCSGVVSASSVRRSWTGVWDQSGLPAPEGYRIFTERVTWDEAKANCQNGGGILATIHSRDANNFAYDLALNAGVTGGFWIGGKRVATGRGNDDWSWDSLGCDNDSCPSHLSFDALPNIDGDSNHDLWIRKEPNNFKNQEDCIRAGNPDSGLWNDAQCSQTNAYMCYFHRG